MNKITPYIARIAIFSGLAIGGMALLALADWTAPVSAPPTCASGNPGCDAPLNVSGTRQHKEGHLDIWKGLSVNIGSSPDAIGLFVFGSSIFNGGVAINGHTIISDGTQGDGKVLTSDASGGATWRAPGASTGVSSITAGPNISVNRSTGDVTISATNSGVSQITSGNTNMITVSNGGVGNVTITGLSPVQWFNIDGGFTPHSGNDYVTWPAGADHSPDQMCKNHSGYSTFAGACKGSNGNFNFQGTVIANDSLGGWSFACWYGNTQQTFANAGTQILCSK